MIGAAKIVIASPTGGSPALAAYASPSPLLKVSPNGSYTSPFIEAYPSAGVSPYTYAWSVTSGFTLSSTTDKSVKLSCSGYNDTVSGTLTCVVTDTALNDVTINVPVTILFENFGL